MKEFNIIEAVEYLLVHPNAIITREDNACNLIFLENKHRFMANIFDIQSKWILQKSKPTHKEIMQNWFKRIDGTFIKVKGYDPDDEKKYLFDNNWYVKEYFDNLEMKTQKEIENMEG